jgi:class 3 adenylate cyclase
VVLAETEKFQWQIAQKRNVMRTVTVALDTTDNEWVMTVAYPVEEQWMGYVIGLVVMFAVWMALLIQTLLVQQRQYKTMEKKYLDDVAQPQKLRLKLFLEGDTSNKTSSTTAASSHFTATNINNNNNNIDEEKMLNVKPIADMYPKTTVMFADIAGFTAWSSERSPALIFSLLQNIFFAFDKLAEKYGIFKVDTIGDCYVAVTGFPEPQDDHAVRMAKFARDCLAKVPEITKRLEQRLGPDTGDLRVRFGLHSGPVTAGVLAGDKKARVQLLGETMDTAAKIEALGKQNRIHMSEATAQLLREAGKQKWVSQRADLVHAKGKGQMQTYWLIANHQRNKTSKGRRTSEVTMTGESLELPPGFEGTSQAGSELWGVDDDDDSVSDMGDGVVSGKTGRLVEWHVEFLVGLIKQIVARRVGSQKNNKSSSSSKKRSSTPVNTAATLKHETTVLEEVKEVISLPQFNSQDLKNVGDIDTIIISNEVIHQLRDYVSEIAMLYHGNPFHNFEHASHVTMAVHKLLNRIVTPEDVNYQRKNASKIASDLHEYTFGITSDPLTHFAVVVSALIHDVDHSGVSNGRLAIEDPTLAERYQNQSIAEQNSVDIAWNLLMEPKYADLHACIFSNQGELLRFRQIIVNSVLATDIFDKELKALRNLRWDKAFHPERFPPMEVESSSLSDPTSSGTDESDGSKWHDTNRKATIVIEHIIQASDVAHTMQHWHVYTKWNEKLFQEMYVAWQNGRAPNDPSTGWYKGELWFFDNYIVPLGQKLAECGVFGVASDECLHNALQNRSEWESRGESVVAEMVENCRLLYGKGPTITVPTELA